MTLAPVPLIPAAVRDALERRGIDAARADAAARGLLPIALAVDGLDARARDAIALAAHEQGIACLTGEGWVLVAGGVAQLAGLARPGFSRLDDALADALGASLGGLAHTPAAWDMARGSIALEAPVLVGILNMTPDSFSDGGQFLDPDAAVRQADRLVADGAGMIDLGGESTRPGRPEPVSTDDEWRRIGAALERVVAAHPDLPVSVDTVKAVTARRAIDAGAWVINDVSGLRLDPGIAAECAKSGSGMIVMHSRGTLRDMASYDHAEYVDVIREVSDELSQAVARATDGGVSAERVVVDPGLGFGKRPHDNFVLLQRLGALRALGRPIMVGPSRKRFLGTLSGRDPAERDAATAAACVAAHAAGARLFRVHNVAVVKEALDVGHAIGTA